jgi:hypothetical protein
MHSLGAVPAVTTTAAIGQSATSRRTLKTPVMRGAICCGQNSLPIHCLGVLLAFVSHVALLDISNGIAMQIALSVGGIIVMIVGATLLNLISIKPRLRPATNGSLPSDNMMSQSARRSYPLGSSTDLVLFERDFRFHPVNRHHELGHPCPKSARSESCAHSIARVSTCLRWSFGHPGLPHSFLVSRGVLGTPIGAEHIFKIGNT